LKDHAAIPNCSQQQSGIDLRSSAIGSTISARCAFVSWVRAGCVGSSAAGATGSVALLRLLLVEIHKIAISIAVITTVPQLLHRLLNVHILVALQDVVHNLAHTLIALTEPTESSLLVLCLALHPEEVSLTAGGELENIDATVCR
jgi:hypothetical protein